MEQLYSFMITFLLLFVCSVHLAASVPGPRPVLQLTRLHPQLTIVQIADLHYADFQSDATSDQATLRQS